MNTASIGRHEKSPTRGRASERKQLSPVLQISPRRVVSTGGEVQLDPDIEAALQAELPTFHHAALAAAIRVVADQILLTPAQLLCLWQPEAHR